VAFWKVEYARPIARMLRIPEGRAEIRADQRPELETRIVDGLAEGPVLVAGAGFGKTVALAQALIAAD
jgi:hypothetical protein